MLELFDQVARQTNTPLGFENAADCWLGPRSVLPNGGGRVLQARTAREAFDEIAAFTEVFSWREITGVVVVRPILAWSDDDSFLSLPVGAFQLLNVSLDDALYRALDAATPRLRYSRAHRSSNPFEVPMSVDFGGGTLLGALSRLDSSATAFVPPIAWKPT